MVSLQDFREQRLKGLPRLLVAGLEGAVLLHVCVNGIQESRRLVFVVRIGVLEAVQLGKGRQGTNLDRLLSSNGPQGYIGHLLRAL